MSELVPPFAVVCLLPSPVVAALDLWRMQQPGKPSREEAAVEAIARFLLAQDLDLPRGYERAPERR
jgi:hypothetical protein